MGQPWPGARLGRGGLTEGVGLALSLSGPWGPCMSNEIPVPLRIEESHFSPNGRLSQAVSTHSPLNV